MSTQADFFNVEKEEYLSQQLITYLGNKRALLGFIGEGIKKVQKRLGKNKLKMFDVFSGSGIVARYFKQFSELLLTNDLENYSRVINECYLSNREDRDKELLEKYYRELVGQLNDNLVKGIIAECYAPMDDNNIKSGERAFYTVRNAMYVDTARQLIDKIPESCRKYFLAPLLAQASVHANTSGVFKGFYKNRETGVGQFGGKKQDALSRIRGEIRLPFPVFSNFNCQTKIYQGDSNEIIKTADEVDAAYLDPPYNQHPYGSNYFMLNLILDYKRPEKMSEVSGIPVNWNRSEYNKKNEALRTLMSLVENIKSKYVIISFNSDGFISLRQMDKALAKYGDLEISQVKYNSFRGSRNLSNREIHVREYLFLLEKS
ncbi:MAG: DNA adenine methylase [Treponema sp.]|nr:DNA adenine methylase [Treponema sp.]